MTETAEAHIQDSILGYTQELPAAPAGSGRLPRKVRRENRDGSRVINADHITTRTASPGRFIV